MVIVLATPAASSAMVALRTACQCDLRNAATDFSRRDECSFRPKFVQLSVRKPPVSPSVAKRYMSTSSVRSVQRQRHVCLSSATESVDDTDINEVFKEAARNGDATTIQELLSSAAVDINSSSPARAGWTGGRLLSSSIFFLSWHFHVLCCCFFPFLRTSRWCRIDKVVKADSG